MLFLLLPAFFSFITIGIAQTFNSNSVDDTTKEYWCNSQESQCPLICGDEFNTGSRSNRCDPDTLDYQCVCNNGRTPNSTEYSLTIPYFECQNINSNCVKNCGQGQSQCQNDCNTRNPCGARSPKKYNRTTASASSSAPTSSPTGGQAINGDTGAANRAVANIGAALFGLVITAAPTLL